MTQIRSRKRWHTERFDCPVLGGEARVRKQYLELDVGKRTLIGIDCDGKDACGVGTPARQDTTYYDWSICPQHPKE